MRRPPIRALALALFLMAIGRPVHAIIVVTSSSPNSSSFDVTQIDATAISDPTYANSGAQYEGHFGSPKAGGSGTATIIGPHQILTATHLDSVGDPAVFAYNNNTYNATSFTDVGNGMMVVNLDGAAFTHIAPILPNSAGVNSVSSTVTSFGFGQSADGAAVIGPDGTQGFQLGGNFGQLTFGAARSQGYFNDTQNGVSTIFGFFFPGSPFSASYNGENIALTLSPGDSGGGVFVNKGGVWELAAVNFGSDFQYTGSSSTNPSGFFDGALFDQSGFTVGGVAASGPQDWEATNISLTVFMAISHAVPEPAALSLAVCGGIALASGRIVRWRRRGQTPRN